MNTLGAELIRQHLIDPEICIRCNTCEDSCPIDAVTHDDRNYVVRAEICNGCGACIAPCPTGAIDNWRLRRKDEAWSLAAQFSWDSLPAETAELWPDDRVTEQAAAIGQAPDPALSATRAPASAATPRVNLYTPMSPAVATVAGNYRVTAAGRDSDTHHIVLDFGNLPFPVLEGQSIGIVPPGTDASGRPHHARQYSLASPRDGERRGYNNLSLTVKRVTLDHNGRPVHGVCSNHLCDLAKGDTVTVIGPFGTTFLMPDDPDARLLMICTGTGSAPMRAMTERRRRLRQAGESGRLTLFFGARTPEELPYFGPLTSLPADFIDVNLAFSRVPGQAKCYVQDLMRTRAADLGRLLADDRTCIYVCGLKGMEPGVVDALGLAAAMAGLDWTVLAARLKAEGRLHFETY